MVSKQRRMNPSASSWNRSDMLFTNTVRGRFHLSGRSTSPTCWTNSNSFSYFFIPTAFSLLDIAAA